MKGVSTMSSQKENRIVWLDFLRVLACIAVIILHITEDRINNYAVGTNKWLFLSIYDSLSRFAVPVFVMISGALLLDRSRKWDLRRFYTKNFVRIIASFIFWGGIYAVTEYLRGVRLRTIAYNFITGNSNLWFLYMIAGLYLLIPIFRRITESENLTRYFLALWFCFSVFLPTIVFAVSYFKDMYANWLQTVTDSIGLQMVIGYSGYFILGHFLYTHDISKRLRGVLYGAGVFGVVLIASLTFLFSAKRGYSDYSFGNYFTFGVLMTATAVFVLLQYHVPRFKSAVAKKCIVTVSVCSFGIYLIHPLFVENLDGLLHLNTLVPSTLMYVPLLTAIVFLLSLLCSYVLHKIPVIRDYIV